LVACREIPRPKEGMAEEAGIKKIKAVTLVML